MTHAFRKICVVCFSEIAFLKPKIIKDSRSMPPAVSEYDFQMDKWSQGYQNTANTDYLDQTLFLKLLSSICSGDLSFHGHNSILLFLTFIWVQWILYLKITFHLIQNANLKEFTKANERNCVLHIHKSRQIHFSIMPYSVKIALKSPNALLLFIHKWSNSPFWLFRWNFYLPI